MILEQKAIPKGMKNGFLSQETDGLQNLKKDLSFFFKSTKFYLSIEVQSENTKEFKIFLQNIHSNSSTS